MWEESGDTMRGVLGCAVQKRYILSFVYTYSLPLREAQLTGWPLFLYFPVQFTESLHAYSPGLPLYPVAAHWAVSARCLY